MNKRCFAVHSIKVLEGACMYNSNDAHYMLGILGFEFQMKCYEVMTNEKGKSSYSILFDFGLLLLEPVTNSHQLA